MNKKYTKEELCSYIMDILKSSSYPMPTAEIAIELLKQHGIERSNAGMGLLLSDLRSSNLIYSDTDYVNGKAVLMWAVNLNKKTVTMSEHKPNENATNKFMVTAVAEAKEAEPVAAKIETSRDAEKPVVANNATAEHETVIDQIIDAAQTVIALAEAMESKPIIDNIPEKIKVLSTLLNLCQGNKTGFVLDEIISDYEKML